MHIASLKIRAKALTKLCSWRSLSKKKRSEISKGHLIKSKAYRARGLSMKRMRESLLLEKRNPLREQAWRHRPSEASSELLQRRKSHNRRMTQCQVLQSTKAAQLL